MTNDCHVMCQIRAQSGGEDVFFPALRLLLPVYWGPAVHLYRGQVAQSHGRDRRAVEAAALNWQALEHSLAPMQAACVEARWLYALR